MVRFTWSKLADIHLAHGAAYGDVREEERIYHERFPTSLFPDYRTFASVDRHLRETGTFAVNRPSRGRGRSVRTPQFNENVLSTIPT